MHRRPGQDVPPSEITPEALYLRRREFIRNAALFTATSAGVGGGLLWLMQGGRSEPKPPAAEVAADTGRPALTIARRGPYGTDEAQTPFRDCTSSKSSAPFGRLSKSHSRHVARVKPREDSLASAAPASPV